MAPKVRSFLNLDFLESPDPVQQRLDESFAHYLPRILGPLAAFFSVMSLFQWLFIEDSTRLPRTLDDLITGLSVGVLALISIKSRNNPQKAKLVGLFACVLMVGNLFVTLELVAEPFASIFFLFLFLGMGMSLMSPFVFFSSLGFGLVSWSLNKLINGGGPELANSVIMVLGSVVISSITFVVKHSYYSRLEKLRISEEEQKRKLEELANARSMILANVSHEMRTPLSVIMAANQILEESQDPTAKSQEYIRLIGRSSESLLSMVNDILDMKLIDEQKLVVNSEVIVLREFLQDLAFGSELKVKEKGLRFKMAVAENIPSSLRGDGVRLKQILTNLLSNAIKFTDRGEVTLRVAVNGAGPEGKKSLEFTVIDTGPGILPEHLQIIFEPFHQVHRSTGIPKGGTGLGLAIARRLAELMGARIEVESRINQGSEFRLILPAEFSL